MNELMKDGLSGFRRQIQNESAFLDNARLVRNLLAIEGHNDGETLLTFLTPMIEVAWVDGRIGRAEQNAILRTAEEYGLLDQDNSIQDLTELLTARPTVDQIDTWWCKIRSVLDGFPPSDTIAISSIMLAQAQYVAELGQKRIVGWWRGYASGRDEEEQLSEITQRLSDVGRQNIEDDGRLKLIPLLKVAWADGRITKKERRLIFDSLFDLGVEPNDENLSKVLEWLEFTPGDRFLNESMQKLREGLEDLHPDERARQKYELLSKCTLLAEVSGGNSQFAGGGARICDEEIIAVKEIAKLLNGAASKSDENLGYGREAN